MWDRRASKAPGPAIFESKNGMKLFKDAATGRAGATGKTHPYMTGEPLPAQTWPRARSGEGPKAILTGLDLT